MKKLITIMAVCGALLGGQNLMAADTLEDRTAGLAVFLVRPAPGPAIAVQCVTFGIFCPFAIAQQVEHLDRFVARQCLEGGKVGGAGIDIGLTHFQASSL